MNNPNNMRGVVVLETHKGFHLRFVPGILLTILFASMWYALRDETGAFLTQYLGATKGNNCTLLLGLILLAVVVFASLLSKQPNTYVVRLNKEASFVEFTQRYYILHRTWDGVYTIRER